MVNILRNCKIIFSFSLPYFFILKFPCIFYVTEIILHCEYYKITDSFCLYECTFKTIIEKHIK